MPRRTRLSLFVAFAFTVMADPVSSVAYAVQAALVALDGARDDLLLTMGLVLAAIALVSAGYHRLITRFPRGGGGARALAAAFGEGWAFLPVGALLVDFTLTIAVSCSAASSALIAQAPGLADDRTLLAIGLAALVAGGSLLGNRGRIGFATVTLAFVAIAAVVLVRGFLHTGTAAPPPAATGEANLGLTAALLAMPLGMALATGVEAPSNAIAGLGQLDDRGRVRFGQLTIWLMVAIVAVLTLAVTGLVVRFGLGLPGPDSTLLADVARRSTNGDGWFTAFQVFSALLLLAAAASSFLAGSGLLKALAASDGGRLLPAPFAQINRAYAPPWGILALLIASVALIVAAGGDEQTIVRFYAVAVFASFLGALVAGTRLSWRDGRTGAAVADAVAVLVVAFVLVLNIRRGDGAIALAVSALVSMALWRAWVVRGRPGGVAEIPGGSATA